MTTAKLNLPCPPYLPAGHFNNPARSIMDTSGDLIATYCAQTATGAIFRLGSQSWVLTGPVSLDEFLAALPTMQIHLPDGEDLQRWLDCVGTDPVRDLLANLN